MRALVVGGSGFLGLNIIEALQRAGHDVVATRRKTSNTIFLRRLKVPMVTATLEDEEALAKAMHGRDVVFFAGAHYPRFSINTETQVQSAVIGAKNLIAAARRAGVARVVYTGSVVTVARPANGSLAREIDGIATPPEGSTYFAVKLALEQELMGIRDIEVIHLLPTGCLGPYDHKVGTGFFVVGLATGALSVYTDGRINLVDARDVAMAHVAAARDGRAGERIILGGHNVTVTGLLLEMARLLDVAVVAREVSATEAVALATQEEERCLREGGRPTLSREIVDMIVHGQHVDASQAEQDLGFVRRPLADTILASYQWYRDNGFIRRP